MAQAAQGAEIMLEYEELLSQPYQDCVISAGFVYGHDVDTIYLKFDRPADGEPLVILLRPDEAAAVAWCMTGALFSNALKEGENG